MHILPILRKLSGSINRQPVKLNPLNIDYILGQAKGKRQEARGKRQKAALFSPHPTPHTRSAELTAEAHTPHPTPYTPHPKV